MEFTPVSEGFLNLFKKKIKEPSKVEKSNINERMKPTNPLIGANTKLMEMYPDDTAKEFKKRKEFLKTLLNVITEASKKFKDAPGIRFDLQIEYLKALKKGKHLFRKKIIKINIAGKICHMKNLHLCMN